MIIPKVVCLPWNHVSGMATTLFFTYQTHNLIVAIATETFSRQRQRANKQAMREEGRKTKRKEETNQLSFCQMTSFVPPLSFLSHLQGWTESSFSLSCSLGWLIHWSPWRHLFPCLSLLLLSAATIFPETLWISHKPFCPILHFSYFLISQPGHKFNTCLKKSLSTFVHQSVCFFPTALPFILTLLFLNFCQAKHHSGTMFFPIFSQWFFHSKVHTCK